MGTRAGTLPARVAAIALRRAPAFQPRPGERAGLAWAVRAALPSGPQRRIATSRATSGRGPDLESRSHRSGAAEPSRSPEPSAEPVVTVEPWRRSQLGPVSVSAARGVSTGAMSSIAGLVAACFLAVAGWALATLVPFEQSPPAGSPPSPTSTATPSQTVLQYIDAINERNYRTAWELGGRNLGGSYDHFVAGFADTAHYSVTIVSVSGDVVSLRLASRGVNGMTQHYEGTYTVRDGVIRAASLHQV